MGCAGRKRLMARSVAGGSLSATGSLTASAPGGMVTAVRPAKVRPAALARSMVLPPLLMRDVRGADGERRGAELIGEDDTHGWAADGDVDDLAQGGVGGAVDDGGRAGWARGGVCIGRSCRRDGRRRGGGSGCAGGWPPGRPPLFWAKGAVAHVPTQ